MGTTTTFRVERPDGTASEVVRYDGGRITIGRIGCDQQAAGRFTIEPDPEGNVTVTETGADGAERVLEPDDVEKHINPYGLTNHRATYAGLTTVTTTYDDDGRRRSVSMSGDWGEQALEVRPDGARIMTWTTSVHHGTESRNSSGQLDHYEVSFNDGSHYRWNRVGDGGRAQITDWSGTTSVIDRAPPPVADETGP